MSICKVLFPILIKVKDAVPPILSQGEGNGDREDASVEAPKDCSKWNVEVLVEPNNEVQVKPYEVLCLAKETLNNEVLPPKERGKM